MRRLSSGWRRWLVRDAGRPTPVRAVRRRRRDHRAALPRSLPNTTRRSCAPSSATRPRSLRRPPADGARRRRRGGLGASRCSSGRRRRASASTRCSPGVDELLAGAERDPDAAVSGRVFKIERTPAGERVAYVRLVRGIAAATAARARRRRRGGEGDVDQGLRAGRSAAAGRARGGRDGGDPRPRLGAGRRRDRRCRRRARRRRRASRGRRSRRSCSPVSPTRPAVAARGARPARRAGPADRRPPGRAPARDRGVALRRGPEGGHRGDARARLRHRRGLPRDDRRVHRAPGGVGGGGGGHPLPRPTRTSRAAAHR